MKINENRFWVKQQQLSSALKLRINLFSSVFMILIGRFEQVKLLFKSVVMLGVF